MRLGVSGRRARTSTSPTTAPGSTRRAGGGVRARLPRHGRRRRATGRRPRPRACPPPRPRGRGRRRRPCARGRRQLRRAPAARLSATSRRTACTSWRPAPERNLSGWLATGRADGRPVYLDPMDYRLYHAVNQFVLAHDWLGRGTARIETWAVPLFALATCALWLPRSAFGPRKWKLASASALASAALALLVAQVIGKIWQRERPVDAHPAAHVWGESLARRRRFRPTTRALRSRSRLRSSSSIGSSARSSSPLPLCRDRPCRRRRPLSRGRARRRHRRVRGGAVRRPRRSADDPRFSCDSSSA